MIFLTPIVKLFGAKDASVLPYAKDYVSVILIGTPFNVLAMSISNLVRVDGHPRLSMYGMMIGAALNSVLDPIYIFIFHWGVKGAAIATITSQIISASILTQYFLRGNGRSAHMRLKKSYLHLELRRIQKVFSLGISTGITQAASAAMQLVINNSLVYYGNQSPIGGDMALSAMGITVKIGIIITAFGVGIGIGSQPIIGYNVGAKKYSRVKRTYTAAVILSSSLIFVFWGICQFMAN